MSAAKAPPMPMLATLGQPPSGAGWAFEMKWDGQRAVADTRDRSVRLFSRTRNDVTGSFPELVDPITAAVGARHAVLDGEIVALGAEGRPSFGRLQRRMHVEHPTVQLRNAFPVTYFVFDVIVLDGASTMESSYLERRQLLDELGLSGRQVQVPPFWTDTDGGRMLDLARAHHLEGVVAKRTESPYRPGRRAPDWIKTPLRKNTEGIVVGWVDGSGAAHGGIGSLLLAAYDDDRRLVYIGHVGTGFTTTDRRSLRARLASLERPTSPLSVPPPNRDAKGAHWVEPELVGDVEYREYTGGSLRHPSWKGLRDDKPPDQVEPPGRH